MLDYVKLQTTVDRLLSQFGRPQGASLVVPDLGGRPGARPGPATDTIYQTRIVEIPASTRQDIALFGGTLIVDQMKLVYMSAIMSRVSGTGPATVVPMPRNRLIIGSEYWTVLGCTNLSPAGVDLLYTMGVQRG